MILEKTILEKYLNKEVEIEEKVYSTVSSSVNALAKYNKSGVFTNFDEDYIELDNKQLINRAHIYRIILK